MFTKSLAAIEMKVVFSISFMLLLTISYGQSNNTSKDYFKLSIFSNVNGHIASRTTNLTFTSDSLNSREVVYFEITDGIETFFVLNSSEKDSLWSILKAIDFSQLHPPNKDELLELSDGIEVTCSHDTHYNIRLTSSFNNAFIMISKCELTFNLHKENPEIKLIDFLITEVENYLNNITAASH